MRGDPHHRKLSLRVGTSAVSKLLPRAARLIVCGGWPNDAQKGSAHSLPVSEASLDSNDIERVTALLQH